MGELAVLERAVCAREGCDGPANGRYCQRNSCKAERLRERGERQAQRFADENLKRHARLARKDSIGLVLRCRQVASWAVREAKKDETARRRAAVAAERRERTLRRREVRRVRRAFDGIKRKQKEVAYDDGAMVVGKVSHVEWDDGLAEFVVGGASARSVTTADWLRWAASAPVIPVDFIRRTIEGEFDLHIEPDGSAWFSVPKQQRLDLLPWDTTPDPRIGFHAWDRTPS